MVVYLDLTEEIIESFNKCVRNGDYKPFLKENQRFLVTLANNLKYVEFEKNSKYDWISKEFSFCLKYLFTFDPKNPSQKIPGVGKLEKNIPEVPRDIKDAISKKDWTDFYWKYRPDADYIVAEARRQEVIDFTINSESGGYESFETRDEVVGYMNEEVVQLPVINNYSNEFSNFGVMVHYDKQPEIRTTSRKHLFFHRMSKPFGRELEVNDNEVTCPITTWETESQFSRQELKNWVQKQLEAQDEQMKLREDKLTKREDELERKVDEIKLREENVEKKMGSMMESLKLTTQKTSEEYAEKSRLQKESYDSNLHQLELRIQEQLRAQEEKIMLREHKLTMREDELDKKVDEIKSMEEQLNKKVDEIRLREENLKRKMEEMMGMVKLVVDTKSTVAAENPSIQITDPIQDKTIIIEPIVTQSDPNDDVAQSPDHFLSADKPTSEDDELQKMEEQFQKDLAEQNRVYEEKLRIAQEKRREMNEKAAEERRQITGDLTRAASFRRSFHS